MTATGKCKSCGEEVTETVEPTWEITKPATDAEDGEIVYTATFTKDGFTTQTKIAPYSKDEYVQVTLIGSSIDGEGAFEPYVIYIPTGKSISDFYNIDEDFYVAALNYFTADGCRPLWNDIWTTTKPVSEFSNWDDVADAAQHDTPLNVDTTLYVALEKAVGTVALSVEKPACGTEVVYDDDASS